MIKKYYWAIAVAAAFVVGTMTTGGVVEAKQSDSLAPLNKILTIDKVGAKIISATSSGDFIVTFCAANDDTALEDFVTIGRSNVGAIMTLNTDTEESGGNCATIGGSAGDTVFAFSTEHDGATVSTAVMQARDSATASLT